MTKLFYTDPLKAAFMAREYAVKFKDGDSFQSAIEVANNASLHPNIGFYIHPDSLSIFEPKEYDIVTAEFEDKVAIGEMANYGQIFHIYGILMSSEYDSASIIQRDGKVFFMPERENEDD